MPAYEKLSEKPVVTGLSEDSYVILIKGGEVSRILASNFVPGGTGGGATIKNVKRFIPVNFWVKGPKYYECRIEDEAVTEEAVVNVSFGLGSVKDAQESLIQPVSVSGDGFFTLYALFAPTNALEVTYSVLKAG